MGHQVVEGDCVDQGGPALYEPVLARPDPLVVLHTLCDCTEDNLPHDLPRYCDQADRCVVPWIFLLTVLFIRV